MITRQLIYAFIGYANYEVNRNNLKLFEKKTIVIVIILCESHWVLSVSY